MQQLITGANLALSQSQCQVKIKTTLAAHIGLDVTMLSPRFVVMRT